MGRRPRVVFDIETLAYPIETFDEQQRACLFKFATTEEDRVDALLRMDLSPFTARVLAVAMLNPDSGQGKVFYEHPGGTAALSGDGLIQFLPGSEESILDNFWTAVTHYPRVITFNGRVFDGPFLMLRSTILGILPTRNLVPYRYSASAHCDLLEQLTFYGASRRLSLDFYCKGFGIPGLKPDTITGLDVGLLVGQGRYRDVAEYCLRNVMATAELFRRWERFLSFENEEKRE